MSTLWVRWYWTDQYQTKEHAMASSLADVRPIGRAGLVDQGRVTRLLLAAGAAAGPFYLALGLAQALTRPGFDLTRHELSQLALGDWGWVQVANFYVSGLLVVAGAIGIAGRGVGRWVARLVACYGLGLLGAGFFTADPGLGFPPGTPADAMAVSAHGVLHLLFAALGFSSLIAASIVLGRHHRAAGQRGWAAYSIGTGVAFLASFVGGAALAGAPATHALATLLLWVAVVLGWGWLTATSLRLRRAA
jgi:hypothetical membrane protein